MQPIVVAVGTMSSIGVCFGFGLAAAYKFLVVKVDPKELRILDALPGINCGACGFPGCAGYAASLAAGEAEANRCLAGGKEVAIALGEIMGIDVDISAKKIARMLCKGGGSNAQKKFNYVGIKDCQMAILVGEGDKQCRNACIGLGTCVRVCKFDAITMDSETGLPVVNWAKCVACGACVRECPKKLFELCGEDKLVNILCSSDAAKGVEVKRVCSVGCIKCKKCIKVCPVNAPYSDGNTVRIDTEKCTNCGTCVKECPVKVIGMKETHTIKDTEKSAVEYKVP